MASSAVLPALTGPLAADARLRARERNRVIANEPSRSCRALDRLARVDPFPAEVCGQVDQHEDLSSRNPPSHYSCRQGCPPRHDVGTVSR